MNLKEIFLEYDEKYNDGYYKTSTNYYSDMKKKLALAFEKMGLVDMSVFKSEKGNEYDFNEREKGAIMYFLSKEANDILNKADNNFLKVNKDTEEFENVYKYVELIEELLKLVKEHAKSEEIYNNTIEDIFAYTRYPLLKRVVQTRWKYDDFVCYYESILNNSGEITGISNFGHLTQSDKLRLYDELIEATRKWVRLVELAGEYRADEVMEGINNMPIDDITTYAFVNEATKDRWLKMYHDIKQPDYSKARSIRALYNKIDKFDEEVAKERLDFARHYCEVNNIDFNQYLKEKEIAERYEWEIASTDEMFEGIKNNQ